MTRVIFRKFSDGEIIAIFPDIESTCNKPWERMSYLHYGQHGACDHSVVYGTTLATPTEYADLHRELVSIGYDDLKIVKRWTR